VIRQTNKNNFSSCAFKNIFDFFLANFLFELLIPDSGNTFKLRLIKNNYGGCSLVAERKTVALEAGVRFSAFTLFGKKDFLKNLNDI
jgi:hypothetical protein